MVIVRALVLLVCTAGVAGCLTSNVLVTVRPDGSGTIERTVQLRLSAMSELEKLLSPDLAPLTRKPPPALIAPPDAGGPDLFGQGLRMRSARRLDSGDIVGWTAIYDFADVTRIGVDLLPRTQGIDVFAGIGADHATNTRLKMTLEPIPDGIERLTVHLPRFPLDPSVEAPAGWASGSPTEMAALKNVLKGSRVTVAIRTEAPLLRTNSPHREGNRVMLFDVDVEQTLFSRQIAMLATTPASFDDLLWAFGDLPGVTLAPDHDVTLEFQDPAAQAPVQAVQAPPDTEIFLATLTNTAGKVTVGTPLNISNSPGYDNQPSFTPDGREILFSSARGGAVASGDPPAAGTAAPSQIDIYRYDIAARRIARVTRTPESEYSPMVMPDGAHISVVRVEADGTQRLWSFSRDGRNPAVVLADVKGVGYHAWIDDRTLALFVLGERGQPATLQIADTQSGKTEVAAVAIGRSLQRTPSGQISYVQRDVAADGAALALTIKQLAIRRTLERASVESVALTRPVAGATDPDLAWMPDGTLLMAHAGILYRWRPGDPEWRQVATLDALGLQGVTRLAVSPKGDRLALVGRPK